MKKILIIEDDKILQKALKIIFQKNSLKVIQAYNGEIGLKKAINECPDVILLDIIMPKVNGLAVLKKINEQNLVKGVPIIIMTNLNNIQQVINTLEFNVAGSKPFKNLPFSSRDSNKNISNYLQCRIKNRTIQYLIKSNSGINEITQSVESVLKNM